MVHVLRSLCQVSASRPGAFSRPCCALLLQGCITWHIAYLTTVLVTFLIIYNQLSHWLMYAVQVMFDYNPSYNPPYYDTSIEKLYDYFEHNPELGVLGECNELLRALSYTGFLGTQPAMYLSSLW